MDSGRSRRRRPSPGFHYYWFLVDGARRSTIPAVRRFLAGRATRAASRVPSPGEDFYQPQDVPHGQVRMEWYLSQVTGQWRRAMVYTPPDYDRDTRARFPVLYLQHGAGENETGWTRQGRANFILDNLIARKQAVPMIVVMDHGYATAPAPPGAAPDPAAARGQGAGRAGGPQGPSAFERVVMTDLMPAIDARYRTRTRPGPTRDRRPFDGKRSGAPDRHEESGRVLVDRAVQRRLRHRRSQDGVQWGARESRRLEPSRASALDGCRKRGDAVDDGDRCVADAARRARRPQRGDVHVSRHVTRMAHLAALPCTNCSSADSVRRQGSGEVSTRSQTKPYDPSR